MAFMLSIDLNLEIQHLGRINRRRDATEDWIFRLPASVNKSSDAGSVGLVNCQITPTQARLSERFKTYIESPKRVSLVGTPPISMV